MKQKNKFFMMCAVKKLFYLGQLLKLTAYHFNMIYSIFIIYITALFKAE
jgi:hypothetical protein